MEKMYMNLFNRPTLLALTMAVASSSVMAASRDYITIVGSSTVYPFTTVVAETFGKQSKFKTPKIESTGTGGGVKLFCAGVGVEHPDITNASRRIKASEVEKCAENGVKEIIEVKIGYDGIVIANSKSAPVYNFTLKDIYLALAKDVPDPQAAGKLIPNPYKTWKDVNPAYPAVAIEVMGPPPTSGTRDAFVELAMEEGCKKIDFIKAMEKSDGKAFKAACHTMREDGAFIEAGENDNLIVQKLVTNPNALGIFGYSFLEQNSDKVKGSLVNGVAPEFEAIANGNYPVSRALFFYVKKAHVGTIPGIDDFLQEFTSEKAWGDEGYLSDKGLIPMPKDERMKYADDAKALNNLKM
ncbi:MAG: PstS family phosphate ABC transporter substrate-binding protein [Gammaproteobacteria bacterium]|nr:PstS family phosphate ABC transporter substrate-binding protein [Gammaproteobacteria bacterium]